MHVGHGSSPRMRGALNRLTRVASATGIIPADAGSTQGQFRSPASTWDHPRGCGEHLDIEVGVDAALGSSPRMRRARLPLVHLGPSQRIIPADAGSTYSHFCSQSGTKDHHRGCGEHFALNGFATMPGGSSPRMRGAPFSLCTAHCITGIIPADAGSTGRARWIQAGGRDHPRGCGEHYVYPHAFDPGAFCGWESA